MQLATTPLLDPPAPAAAAAGAQPMLMEKQLAALLALRTEALISVDAAGRILFFNRGAEEAFGYPADEVLGESLDRLIPERFRAGHANAFAAFVVAPDDARRMSERAILYGLRSDGSEFPAEASISRVGQGDECVLTVVLRDITERWRAEQELQLLHNTAFAVSGADDPDQALQHVLREVCRVTGWVTGEAWMPNGDHLTRSAVWHDAEPDLVRFHRASETHVFTPGDGLPGRVWQSGQPLWLPDVASSQEFRRGEMAREIGLRAGVGIPVLAGDEVVAVMVFYHREVRRQDERMVGLVSAAAAQLGVVMQRKLLEDELARMVVELAQSNAELEQFAYVASHDLQEPLRMVASYTQLLARRYKDRLDDDAREFIGYAVEGVTRMQRLILDLLLLSRVGGNGRPEGTADMQAVAERVIGDLAGPIGEARAQVRADALPAVRGEASTLRLVFHNLIDNALKFRGDTAPEIRITADRQGSQWVFSVADNGIGIDAEYAERVFVVFQRLHTRDKYPGNGIGLALCKKIVERHGGRIWVEPAEGGGTLFRFTLDAA
jgi:PAS domain S-box-containing protein